MKPVATRLVELSVLAAIVIGVASAPASADVVRWHMPGVIEGSPQCPDDPNDPNNPDPFCLEQNEYLLQFFPAGTRVDFNLTIDTHDNCSAPNVGDYEIKELAVTINGVTARGNGVMLRNEHTALGCPFEEDFPMYVAGFFDPLGGEGQTELLLTSVEIFLFGGLPGDDLPTVPPAVGFYLEPSFRERLLGGGTYPGSVVPEPTTLWLLFTGLAAIATRRPPRPPR